MARYRSIQTTFWQDNFVMRLSLMEKAFYNYLLTNTRTSQCGIYNFSVTFASVELGCSEEEVRTLLDKFVSFGKILYDEEHEEIMLLNWYKYNLSLSRNTLICVNRELQDVKNKEFVRRFYKLCKLKKYPLDIIFSGIDVGETIEVNEIKEEAREEKSKKVSEEKCESIEGQASFNDVVRHFNENIHLMSPIELEDIRDWCEKLNEDMVIMAISEAVRNNGRNIKYIDGILINWHSEGLRTAEEVKIYLKDWKERGGRRQKEIENMQNADAYRIVGEEVSYGE
jgi:DnaD/phage-associated family protein